MSPVQRLIPAILLLSISTSAATRPEQRIVSTPEEFLKGEFKGVSVWSDGRLTLAPAFEETCDTSEAFVYDLVPAAGGGFFVATGNNGRIFRLDPEGKCSLYVTLDEPAVYALATDAQNRLYAATSPEGKVYRIGADGKAEKFYEPGEKYIWDLAIDETGNVFVGTGPKGIIYRVSPSGEGRSFYDSEETHIVSLAWDLNRNLLAGSAPHGLLFRLSGTGSPFVLFDSSLEEIKSIAVDRYGVIYAASLSGGGKPAEEKTPAPAAGKEASSPAVESTVEAATASKGARLQLHRIDKDNLVDTIYSSDDELVFDLALRNDGTVLMATGNRGRILALSPQGFLTLLADSREEQVTRVIEQGGALFAATSNLGKVFRLQGETATSGSYESEVIDAGTVSSWGMIRWRIVEPGEAESIRLFTRSGNTGRPDGTWAAWQGPYSTATGSPVQSAPARFLQWKIEFSAPGRAGALISGRDAVDLVTVTYQQRNLPPRLSNLSVLAPGVALVKMPAAQAGGVQPGGPEGAHLRSLPPTIRRLDSPAVTIPSRRAYVPGARSFTWKSSDPNDDDLVYSLYLRREGGNRWQLVAEDLVDEEYTLDGASVADGIYQVRVVVSDRAGNPPSQALEHELVSKPFVIANRVPAVEWQPVSITGSSAQVRFTVRTPVSPVFQVEYTLDNRSWSVVFPEDGIADSPEEQFSLSLENLKPGLQALTVRVVDQTGNVGSAAQSFEIK